jgi:hypothetical protein
MFRGKAIVQGQTILEARRWFRDKMFWRQGYSSGQNVLWQGVQGQTVWKQGYSSGTKFFGGKVIVQGQTVLEAWL